MKKVRWGVIGAGRIANTFAADIALAGNATLQAVASRSATSSQDFARKHNIATAHGGYGAMYADPNVDAVYIATPHTCHAQQTLDAIAAGKAVLCEKPFTVTPQECATVIAHANAADCFVMEALWTWFLPAIRKAKSWVDAGRIGKIVQLHSSFGYPLAYGPDKREYSQALGGGCLLEMGIYPIATNLLFVPDDPRSIDVVARFAPNGVEDDLAMIFSYPDCVSTLSTSYRARLPNWTHVIGERGYVAIPDSFRASECFLYELDTLTDHFRDDRKGRGFEFQIQAASEDILRGVRESTTVPLQASLAFQRQMARVKDTYRV